jgi:hypothetical protein
MALLRRNRDDRDPERDRERRVDERTERAGTSPGVIRAIATLLGVAAAGLLIWIAHAVAGPLDESTTSEYWLAMALIAGAGLVLGLSQLFGGWTKWGWPTLSPMVFLLGFLPTLLVGGWIALAKQPQDGPQEGRVDRWGGDIGVGGLVDDLGTYLPVIPLIVGLILAFSFDTTGPRTRIVSRDRDLADEDVHDYRRERARDATVGTSAGTTTRSDVPPAGTTTRSDVPPAGTTTRSDSSRDASVAEELRTRDDDGTTATTGATRVDREDDADRRTV